MWRSQTFLTSRNKLTILAIIVAILIPFNAIYLKEESFLNGDDMYLLLILGITAIIGFLIGVLSTNLKLGLKVITLVIAGNALIMFFFHTFLWKYGALLENNKVIVGFAQFYLVGFEVGHSFFFLNRLLPPSIYKIGELLLKAVFILTLIVLFIMLSQTAVDFANANNRMSRCARLFSSECVEDLIQTHVSLRNPQICRTVTSRWTRGISDEWIDRVCISTIAKYQKDASACFEMVDNVSSHSRDCLDRMMYGKTNPQALCENKNLTATQKVACIFMATLRKDIDEAKNEQNIKNNVKLCETIPTGYNEYLPYDPSALCFRNEARSALNLGLKTLAQEICGLGAAKSVTVGNDCFWELNK